MAKQTKAAKKKKGIKVISKKVATKNSVTKKKAGAKKAATKKKIASKKGTAVKKSTAVVRNTGRSIRKPSARSVNATTSKKYIRSKSTVSATESQLPPVEENSPAVIPIIAIEPGMDKKSMHNSAVRNFDTPHMPISSIKKGGIKPSGKKPLW